MNKSNNSINKLDTYKLIFMQIPYAIRDYIPLSFWPEWVRINNEVLDVAIDMIEEHNQTWQPGDEILTFLSALEQDRHSKRITESDVISNMQALIIGNLLSRWHTVSQR